MRPPTTALLAAVTMTALVLSGCHAPSEAPMSSYAYTAHDYGFDGPAEMAPGWVEITVTNTGMEPHHIQLFRLTEGKTAADYTEVLDAGEIHPDWVVSFGGPNGAPPGGSSTATVFLEEGTYVMICEIPSPSDGQAHVHKGMVKEITVGGDATDLEEPEPDLTTDLLDFAFGRSGEWDAGSHTIGVTNDGDQPHELVAIRYHDGANFSAVLAALSPNATGPPPADFIGGITGIASDQTQYFDLELTPGRYGFACFLEDPASGAPHFALGMVDEFTVE